jgi:hypothetical protein
MVSDRSEMGDVMVSVFNYHMITATTPIGHKTNNTKRVMPPQLLPALIL